MTKNEHPSYWATNLKILGALLSVWFILSFGCGILFVDYLNKISIKGYKLGFWFGQQGSIIGFVIIILIYVNLMNRLDKKHHLEEED